MQTKALPHFSLDSRNKNLPEKRIHRNYALTTVPMSPAIAHRDEVSIHACRGNGPPRRSRCGGIG
jgi:hypothetical protein